MLVLDPNDSFSGSPPRSGEWPFAPPGLMGIAVIEAAISQANLDFVIDAKLQDPALASGERAARELAADYGLSLQVFTQPHLVQPPSGSTSNNAQATGSAQPTVPRPPEVPRPPADLVLEIRTTDWGLESGPVTWGRSALKNHDRATVFYEVEAKLTDTRDGHVLARGACADHDPRLRAAHKADTLAQAEAILAPVTTYKEMKTLPARRTIEDLGRASERCERKLRVEILSLAPPSATPPAPAAPTASVTVTSGP